MATSLNSVALGLAAALLCASTAVGASPASYSGDADTTPGAGAMVADLAVVRPLSFAATLVGIGVFMVSLPFTAASGDVSGPAKRLITEPAQYTFTRPLGELE